MGADGQIANWTTLRRGALLLTYNTKVIGTHPMPDFPTLQSQDGTMLVGFYPVATPFGDISQEWCMQVLSWKGVDQISRKYLNRVEKAVAIRERLAHDYIITGDNQDLPQEGNPFYGAC